MKIRAEVLPSEIEPFIASLEKGFEVVSVSKPYPNREGEKVRIYIELRAL